MRKLFKLFGLVCLLVSILAIGACQPAAPTVAPKPTTPAVTTPTAPTATPTPAVAKPKYGGTLRTVVISGAAQFDPHRQISAITFISPSIWDNLVEINPNEPLVTLKTIKPGLAQRWEVSPDGKTYTFYLVKNAKWHDGMPFTADDVIYSFEKMMDRNRSTVFNDFAVVNQVVKIDDYTVKVGLANPYVPFLLMLTHPYRVIQAKHLSEVDWRTPSFLVGTGPFKYKSMTSGISMEFIKNPDYFQKDEFGNQLPYLDGWVLNFIADSNMMTSAFISGQLDLFAPGHFPDANQMKQIKQAKPDTVVVQDSGANFPWIFINKNSKVEALRDERVRRAMVMLFDQKEIAIATFGTAENIVEYSRGLFLPGLGNPNAEIAKIQGWDKPYDQRITEAKKLLADAGYAKGFTIYIPSMSAANVIAGTTYIAETWKKHLSIEYKLESVTTADYRKKLLSADFDAILGSLASSGVGDPDDQKNYFVSTSSLNFLGFKNPELDRLWKQQEAEQDPAKRTELIKQAERVAFSEYTMMPYPPSANNRVKYPYVKGYTLQNLFLGAYFHNTWLDK